MPNFEEPEKKPDPGYRPAELEYRDGQFWMPNGMRFLPDFEIKPDPERITLFVEYERTFGRGKAFEITHQTIEESRNPETLEKYGGGWMLSTAHALMDIVPKIIGGWGQPKDSQRYAEQLKEFRSTYPSLYEDSAEHDSPGHSY